jgi:hypothetical protein
MLTIPKSRLASAAAVGAVVCALGAGTAAAATPRVDGTWSGRQGPVPHAFTNASPALASVLFPGSARPRTLVAWRGQGGQHVFYEYSPAGSSTWSALASIPGAKTSTAPSVASYTDPSGRSAVVAVWKNLGSGRIFYAQGQTKANGTITWTAPVGFPTSKYFTTATAPTVFFPLHSYKAVFLYKAPFNHIRYVIGTPKHRGFVLSATKVIASNALASSPAGVTEASRGTAKGTIAVFWKGLGSDQVYYSTTTDPLTIAKGISWTPVTALAGSTTSAAPAASTTGLHGSGSVLLAYKAPHNVGIIYRTLTSGVWSAPAAVPGIQSTNGPALLRNVLAATSPAGGGNIFFETYSS